MENAGTSELSISRFIPKYNQFPERGTLKNGRCFVLAKGFQRVTFCKANETDNTAGDGVALFAHVCAWLCRVKAHGDGPGWKVGRDGRVREVQVWHGLAD